MKCQKCDIELDINTYLSIIFPCCHKFCNDCASLNVRNICIICSQTFTSILKILVKESDNYERVYNHKYKKVCFLDSGSFGCVYVVKSIETKKIYALKSIQLNIFKKYSSIVEIEDLINLKHDFVINYCDKFIDGDLFCILTEYYEGGNLEIRIKEKIELKNKFNFETIFNWTSELLSGITYLHSKGIIHRDVKPANIYLTLENLLKIGDFGVAAKIENSTLLSSLAGTLDYMSPEILSADKKYNNKIDIWSIGCIVFELIKLEKYRHYYENYKLKNINEKDAIFDHLNTLHIFKTLLNKMLIPDQNERSSSAELYSMIVRSNLQNEIEIHSRNVIYTKSKFFNKPCYYLKLIKAVKKDNFERFISNYNPDSIVKINQKPNFCSRKLMIFLTLFVSLIILVLCVSIPLLLISPDNAIKTLKGHTDAVTTLCVLPNNRLASGSQDSTIIIWNTITYSLIRTLNGHKSKVLSLAFLENNLLASGSEDFRVYIWNFEKGIVDIILTEHKEKVHCLALTQNKNLVTVSWDLSLILWDTTTWRIITKKTNAHNRAINSVLVLSDNYLISGAYDYQLKIWDANNLTLIGKKEVDRPIETLVKLTDNSFASGVHNNISYSYVNTWLVETSNDDEITNVKISLERTLKKHELTVTSLALFKEDLLASGSEDKMINIWNISNGKLIATLNDHSKAVRALAVLENGFLVSASDDETIKIRTDKYWNDIL